MYALTFNKGGMSRFVTSFSDVYESVRVPTEFPRKTRMANTTPDFKSSEWRNIALIGFVAMGDIFDSENVTRLRLLWLLTVILCCFHANSHGLSRHLLVGSAHVAQ